jgi:hypothetical protein
MASRWRARGRGLALASLAAMLGACQPPVPQGPAPDGGFVELDENTDPRFVHYDRAGPIGWLRVAGARVYLDGRIVDRDQRLPGNAQVRTGPASGVRAELLHGTAGRCRIAVLELREGQLYGESGTCEHELGTQQAVARSEGTHVTYHASARGDRTVLTVIAGQMRAWSSRAPAQGILVGPMQEALLRPGAVLGPRPVTHEQVRERTAWRAAFDWQGSERAAAACRRYAGTAVEQNDENLRRGCGYSGERWHSDHAYHYQWCLEGGNLRLAERETAARAQALEACGRAEGGSEAAEAILRTLFEVFSSRIHRTRDSGSSSDGTPTPGADGGTPSGADGAAPAGGDAGSAAPAGDAPAIDLRRLRDLRRIEPVEPAPVLR